MCQTMEVVPFHDRSKKKRGGALQNERAILEKVSELAVSVPRKKIGEFQFLHLPS